MKVVLSFDIEVWCNGWDRLDEAFPASFARYVYGRSALGDYALPKTLEILNRHGLHGVFFVEPLFAARFGLAYLAEIVALIQGAGQEVQLHLHPEWTDEISPALIPNNQVKRQHLSYYTLDEQTALIAHGKRLLAEAGVAQINAFRAGSFAANRATFTALARNGITLDSSLNDFYAVSGTDLRGDGPLRGARSIHGVHSFPVSVFRDGLGKPKPAQLSGCSFAELRAALDSAAALGLPEFILVSHNFELLKPDSSEPDRIVVRRFEALCAWLAQRGWPTVGLADCTPPATEAALPPQPTVGTLATLGRYAEQLLRRF